MTFWVLLTVNSVTFGGLLFLLSAGFSLIFGLMRIPNLTHGSMFMLGAYFGTTLLSGVLGVRFGFWLAVVVCAIEVAILGALMERLLLRRLAGQQLAQVLVTLGVSFMVADLCLMGWGGDPISVATPAGLNGFIRFGSAVFPLYRLAVIAIAVITVTGIAVVLVWAHDVEVLRGAIATVDTEGGASATAVTMEPLPGASGLHTGTGRPNRTSLSSAIRPVPTGDRHTALRSPPPASRPLMCRGPGSITSRFLSEIVRLRSQDGGADPASGMSSAI